MGHHPEIWDQQPNNGYSLIKGWSLKVPVFKMTFYIYQVSSEGLNLSTDPHNLLHYMSYIAAICHL